MERTRIKLLDVFVDVLTVQDFLNRLDALIAARRHALVLYANVHGLNLAHENPWMADFYNEAELVFCDGAGVVLGARLSGDHLPERMTMADWIWPFAEQAAARGQSFYLLGARPGVMEKAAERLVERNPTLRIAGLHHGYFDKKPGSPENEAVIADINRARPDALFVAFGMPTQEAWLRDNWAAIDAAVALPSGALFDYVSGELQRAPGWMNEHGLEWLGRLLIEPGRLWQRYILGNPKFLARVLAQKLAASAP
jgi:N-acetylglucosaminyldiphosphoundecaprenol N-acetyl-beta-D-mannosaminyltransferase